MFLTLALSPVLNADAQMTRSQLLRKFYQVTTLHENGKDADAIAICEEIAAAYPKLPDTYMRMAKIYDEGGEEELALVMYRQYISLEMDDKKAAESRQRLAQLEQKFGVESMEKQEDEALKALVAKSAETRPEPYAATSGQKQTVTAAASERPVTAPVPAAGGQKVAGGGVTSFFDLSALAATAVVDQPEPEPEPLVVENHTPAVEEKIVEEKIVEEKVVEEKVVAEEIFAEESTPVPEPEIDLTAIESAVPASADMCASPFLFQQHAKLLEENGIPRVTACNSSPRIKKTFGDVSDLAGRWISSKYDEDTGLEYIIFDFTAVGTGLNVTFDKSSGIFLGKRDNLLSASWSAVRSIWSTDGADYDPSELKDNTMSCTFKPDNLNFVFPLKRKNKPDFATIGKNVMEGIGAVIPFGSIASKMGGNLITYMSQNKGATMFQTILNFNVSSVTDNVLKCTMTVTEKQTGGVKDKELMIESESFYLYRVSQNYDCFRYKYEGGDGAIYKKVYSKLDEESESDPEKLFPLAYMSYYGVGSTFGNVDIVRVSHSLGQMQKLAESNGCNRARAWIVPVCYNLSLDEKHYPMRLQRKYFRDFAEKQLGEMLIEKYPYSYGLQADIFAGSQSDTDKALGYYEQGAALSDPYSLYKLGMVYKEGQLTGRNYEKSIGYFRQAADAGYADAWLQIALAYKNAYGVETDYTNYIKCLYKAIDAGSIDAIKELSLAYFWGIGVERNVETAMLVKRVSLSTSHDVWHDVLKSYGYSL